MARALTLQLNSQKHELALKLFMFIVLFHWLEHLVQAAQIFVLHWSRPEARGVLGHWFPWLVSSELMHYLYALVMLAGIWLLKPGFHGRSKFWWQTCLAIQFWHHFEHLLLQGQALFKHNLFNSPVPMSLIQLWVPRVELHLFYNSVVFVPMIIGMYYHMFPNEKEFPNHVCSCAWNH